MINFYSETSFELWDEAATEKWLSEAISEEGFSEGDISFIFCDDDYLLKLNVQFLEHDTLTDVISFDNSVGNQIHGEIYISEERVLENSLELGTSYQEEMHRVMIHGVLHFCGFKDKSARDETEMRNKEDHYLLYLSC